MCEGMSWASVVISISSFWDLGSGDDNVGIGGVSSSFASKCELRVWYFVFIRGPI